MEQSLSIFVRENPRGVQGRAAHLQLVLRKGCGLKTEAYERVVFMRVARVYTRSVCVCVCDLSHVFFHLRRILFLAKRFQGDQELVQTGWDAVCR